MTRYAIVRDGAEKLLKIRDYLPGGYWAIVRGNDVIISGHDRRGWTLDGYVIPRLESGLILAEEFQPIR